MLSNRTVLVTFWRKIINEFSKHNTEQRYGVLRLANRPPMFSMTRKPDSRHNHRFDRCEDVINEHVIALSDYLSYIYVLFFENFIESASKLDSIIHQRLWSRGYDSRLGLSQDIKCERSQVRVLATADSFAFWRRWERFGGWRSPLDVQGCGRILGQAGKSWKRCYDWRACTVCQGGSQELGIQRSHGREVKSMSIASPWCPKDVIDLR